MSSMCRRSIFLAYQKFVTRTSSRIPKLEQYMRAHDIALDDFSDESINDLDLCHAIFSPDCRCELENIFRTSLNEIQTASFSGSEDDVLLLVFIQDLAARGLWKYHLDVGDLLDNFAREFDRLDVPSEQARLFEWAQKQKV